MPLSINQGALTANSNNLGAWLDTSIRLDFDPIRPQIVPVRKSKHGVRPVAELALRDRLMYRALVDKWSDNLAPPDRSSEAYHKFKWAPLEDAPSYVVSSDITAFYQYIDYDLLQRELDVQVRDPDGIAVLMEFLRGLSGRNTGVPQQNYASDVLAEALADVLERALLHSNLKVWRYNDDFRIATTSWSESLAAIDLLETRARQMGLALNDGKTVIRKVAKYRDYITRRDAMMDKIANELGIDLGDYEPGPYQEFDADDLPEGEAAAYQAVLERWLTARNDELDELEVLSDLVKMALSNLAGDAANDRAVEICLELLKTEQHLTPQVCQFLERIPGELEQSLLDRFAGLLQSGRYLTTWQCLWLQRPLARLSDLMADGDDGRIRARWVREIFDNVAGGEVVRSAAALTLARHQAIDTPELMTLYDEITPVSRPVIASALGVLGTNEERHRAVIDEDPLHRWCCEWALVIDVPG